MILPIKPICKKEWIRRYGTSVIFLQYCLNSEERVLVDTGLSIPPEYWNRKNNCISAGLPLGFGEVKDIENHLSQKMRRAEDLLKYAITQSNISPAKFLKEKFPTNFDPVKSTAVLKKQESIDVFYHIHEYLKAKDGKVKQCTLNVIGR
jgi:hypothetical protein